MRIKYLLFTILLSLSFICISNVDALTTTKVNVYGGTNIRNNTSNGYKNIINYDDVVKVRGMDIVFVTTAKSNEEAFKLLSEFGMPFKKN